ncbi:MAG: HAMP domain-containing histidine kinase [Anaerolineae bacterium]|nr:HAMP domain-containing histidine kinase [Anaerolineae bacterium]
MADDKSMIAAQVLSSIAHDLRSPLNAVIGFSKIMIKGLDGPLTDMQLADLEAIHTNGQMMLDMVNEIVDLGKLEAGTLVPGQSEVYLTSVIEKVTTQAESLLKNEPVSINSNTGDPLISIRAEEMHIRQLILDLILITAHLVQTGAVTLSVESDRHLVSVSVLGQAQDGLSLDAQTIFEAYRSGGASPEQRVDLYSLKLLACERRTWLYHGEFWGEQSADSAIAFGFKLPTSRSQI